MAALAALGLAACTPAGPQTPVYGPIETRLMDGELVEVLVEMQGARDADHVIAFNDCAAAQYTLVRGARFVRRVANDVTREGRTWRGRGVYTLSDAYPGGRFTIDAQLVAQACRADNIPLV